MGASKAGGGWQESNNDHTTTTAGNNEWRVHAADDEGSNKEGKGIKTMAMAIRVVGDKEGNGISNKSGMQ